MGDKLKYNRMYRYIIIVWIAVKFILQIYLFFLRHRIWDGTTREKWDALLVKQAIEYREKAVKLGGVLIKVGQFLSTRTDFMPDVFIRELSGLVDRVPSGSFPHAKALMEKEWGEDIGVHLSEITESPIASASIGEVYRAKLKDGSDVAVKVQRYRIQEVFHKDFKALKIVFRLISFFTSFGKKADLKALYRELITVMDKELDFEQEMEYGIYFKERYQDYEGIYIPDYHQSLCGKKILVMEWIDGAKITDIPFMNRHHIDVEDTAERLFDFYFDQFLSPGYFHADPHAGNILIQQNGMITIIDFGMIGDVGKPDIQYFKRLIRGLITGDYDLVIEALREMDFVLPGADNEKLKKMLKQTVELYKGGSFSLTDAHVMGQIKDDIRVFVKDQPIQLSADYAYLGRAISIIYGILISLYPDIDLEKWARPKVSELLGGKSIAQAVYKEVAKDAVKPVIEFPRAVLNWLGSGEEDRKWEQKKQQYRFMHQFYLLVEVISFIMVIIGIIITGYGFGLVITSIKGLGFTIILVSFFILIISFIKHFRWIRTKGRGW